MIILCCGAKEEAIENLIQQLKNNDRTIKVDYDVSDYLSCEIYIKVEPQAKNMVRSTTLDKESTQ
jgi:hypothetical protein